VNINLVFSTILKTRLHKRCWISCIFSHFSLINISCCYYWRCDCAIKWSKSNQWRILAHQVARMNFEQILPMC